MNRSIDIVLLHPHPEHLDHAISALAELASPPPTVHAFTDLCDGVRHLEAVRSDVVLMSLDWPMVSGVAALDMVRRFASEPLVVVLVPDDQEALGEACLRSGAVDYFTFGSCQPETLRRVLRFASVSADMNAALRDSEARYRGLFEGVIEGIYQSLPDGTLVSANPAFVRMLGYSSEEELKRQARMQDFYPDPEQRDAWRRKLELEGSLRNVETVVRRKDGAEITTLENSQAIRDADGNVLYYQGTLTDITERKEWELRLEQLARFDGLTGLLNRPSFDDRLERVLERAQRSNTGSALLFLDLDGFKSLNDTLGHATGDELLREVARRLESNLRPSDAIGRLGGDEFAVLLAPIEGPEQAAAVANKLLDAVRHPYSLGDQIIRRTCSIGISLARPGISADTLKQQADVALYKAKEAGRARFAFYDEGMARSLREFVGFREELAAAIDNGEFFLEIQPQYNLSTGEIIAGEALVRWRHPVEGIVSPGRFVPVCEQTGLIVPLGTWVLEESCRLCRTWLDRGLEVPIAVNVSATQLRDPAFVGRVRQALCSNALPPGLLHLELTESTLLEDTDLAKRTNAELREMGVQLVIDDFGTGYSSLQHLRRHAFRKLKIDMEFVQGVVHDADDAAIVATIIALGHMLDLTVLAEGVETPDQAEFLLRAGCDEVQGFLYNRPLSAAAFERELAAGHFQCTRQLLPARPRLALVTETPQ